MKRSLKQVKERGIVMQENYELVQRGFRVLLTSLSGYIGQELSHVYRNKWWDEILYTLGDQRDLPDYGSYGDLVDSLDIANCFRLLDRKWNDVFREVLPLNCRTWSKELMGVRNIVAHIGQQDLEQPMAERALDTMVLLCEEIDPEGAEELRALYRNVRARAEKVAPLAAVEGISGLAQPESESRRGTLLKGSLLQRVGTDDVQKTTLTRKITFGGKTTVYPVYRVRLGVLFYNDQNDRIATWIPRYEAENGEGSLKDLDREIYNRIIENFIVESNPDAIQKTQRNIAVVGQREPGVTLADGRIVDGNRRFTCLRRLQRERAEPLYFETVLLDMDIQADRKQIKLLELAIQHGEEKKVDYDLIDYAVGTYRDVVQTGLLTVEEYASTANEAPAEVRKRIEIAALIDEFLSYIRLPGQYHVAREYQIYSLFQEMMAPLKKLEKEERDQLKHIVFHNAMLGVLVDQRKFIRDVKGLIKSGTYDSYFQEQKKWGQEIAKRFAGVDIQSKEDIDRFARENQKIVEELQISMERALLRSRSRQLKTQPTENVVKCISLLMDIDSRLFGRMEEEDKETLKADLAELVRIAEKFRTML